MKKGQKLAAVKVKVEDGVVRKVKLPREGETPRRTIVFSSTTQGLAACMNGGDSRRYGGS